MERTLTWRDLNRALLARQCLLARVPADPPAVLERMAGLQAQYAPSMYIGLWTRIEGFERESLTRLLEDREVVQATLLRATIHLVSRADFWPFVVAVREARRDWYHRVIRNNVGPAQLAEAAEGLRKLLRQRPVRRAEIDQLYGAQVRGGVGMYLDMVRVPPSGTWSRRRADLFGLAEDWVPPTGVTVAEARELLVRRYLGGFGPAHRSEIADWAGLSVADVAKVLAPMELRRFRDERGRELVDLPDQPLPDPDTPAPVRFLPTYDATLLAHARRTLILPEEHRTKVFHVRMPQSIGTFLVDGQVAGTWSWRDGAVVWEPFAPLPARVRRQVDAEAGALTAFHATS
ncbi:AlkZ family DNA glycosylase [Dactylosporangium aurantiacum]|uniref:AlkZ family DNA glycosylase n=1 Tax=Dactylosporangium aurantiacum TaxID=35754 RepID=A0A9Q9ML48_9ACTN|nr:winged helix DNA-binding domain-containing protein [Dactylosporangium aurantiacum]MDG6102247.1 winged helix DNA-binding domain-containing protein [Dactylosporangium aurantiacum]UWZ53442.1 AlkZ family DNA glycosylase [Dactylosporangium aurantiacum]